MNSPKASEDYIKLKKFLLQGYKPEHISINLSNTNEKATITLVKDKLSETIISTEDDVIMLSFSIKSLFDQKGNSLLGEVKDLGKLYSDAEMLYDPDKKKFHAAREKISKGDININYVPHLLLRQFLEETSLSKSKPYLILKEDYYVIKFLLVEELRMIYIGSEGLRKQVGAKKKIYDVVQNLFKDAFHKNPNALKNYHLFQKFNKADVMDMLISSSKDLNTNDSLFDMLSKRDGVPAEEGLRHILSAYSSLAETVNKLLNIIRGAIEIVEGKPNTPAINGTVENWLLIKNHPKYSIIVEEFDPRIRHGKAHNNFSIDVDKGVINFYAEGRIRKVAFSYTFDEIRTMWHRVHMILSVLIVSVCMEQSALTFAVLDSGEYKMSLLRLGNFKKLGNHSYNEGRNS